MWINWIVKHRLALFSCAVSVCCVFCIVTSAAFSLFFKLSQLKTDLYWKDCVLVKKKIPCVIYIPLSVEFCCLCVNLKRFVCHLVFEPVSLSDAAYVRKKYVCATLYTLICQLNNCTIWQTCQKIILCHFRWQLILIWLSYKLAHVLIRLLWCTKTFLKRCSVLVCRCRFLIPSCNNQSMLCDPDRKQSLTF